MKSIFWKIFRVYIKSGVVYTLEYFEKKYNLEVFVYPVFKLTKCNYDSHEKIGYCFEILEPVKGSKNCFHIDDYFFQIYPETLLDMEDEEYDTIEKVGFAIYESRKEAYQKALVHLINRYK
jgi:hypothetical protein